MKGRIRACGADDVAAIVAIINTAAWAYAGVIPADRWREPYMRAEDLGREIAAGVRFWGHEDDSALAGVMGIQRVREVTLIRHAYVDPARQRSGIGTALLKALRAKAETPLLIGTWADAAWAVRFYEKNGFTRVPAAEKDRLLRTYWSIPQRQIATSVVLADAAWLAQRG